MKKMSGFSLKVKWDKHCLPKTMQMRKFQKAANTLEV